MPNVWSTKTPNISEEEGGYISLIKSTGVALYNRGGVDGYNEGKRTLAYYPKIDDKYCFFWCNGISWNFVGIEQIPMIWKYYDDELRSAITKDCLFHPGKERLALGSV